MTRGKRATYAWHVATTSAAAVIFCLLCLQGCAEMSSDDCADKARCPDLDAPQAMSDIARDDAADDTTVEASVTTNDDAADGETSFEASVDAASGDATIADGNPDDVAADAPLDDRALPDSSGDAADDSPDVGPGDGASDDSPDVVADVATDDGPTACDARNPDCSSPSCQPSFACAPAAPAGWTGPAVLFDSTSAAAPAPTAAACPTTPQYATDAYDGHATPFAQGGCSCTCGAVAAATCGGPTVTVYQDSQCGTSCAVVANVSACAKGCAMSTALSAAVTANPTPAGGSCPPSVANALVPWNMAADWTTTGRVCAASRIVTQGGCAANQVCADSPPPGTVQAWCVYQTGSVSCPAAYPRQHVYFAGGTDGRGCTGTCGCGAATGVTCTIQSVSVSATSDCAAPATFTSTAMNQCNGNLTATARNVTASVSPAGGQCAPSGSAAVTGAVAPTTPTTVCCTQ